MSNRTLAFWYILALLLIAGVAVADFIPNGLLRGSFYAIWCLVSLILSFKVRNWIGYRRSVMQQGGW